MSATAALATVNASTASYYLIKQSIYKRINASYKLSHPYASVYAASHPKALQYKQPAAPQLAHLERMVLLHQSILSVQQK